MVEQSAVNRLAVGSSPTWGDFSLEKRMKRNVDQLRIGEKTFNSRLMLGTGKYRTMKEAVNSIEESKCEIVTVAIRRLPTDLRNDTTTFLNQLNWKKLSIKLCQ